MDPEDYHSLLSRCDSAALARTIRIEAEYASLRLRGGEAGVRAHHTALLEAGLASAARQRHALEAQLSELRLQGELKRMRGQADPAPRTLHLRGTHVGVAAHAGIAALAAEVIGQGATAAHAGMAIAYGLRAAIGGLVAGAGGADAAHGVMAPAAARGGGGLDGGGSAGAGGSGRGMPGPISSDTLTDAEVAAALARQFEEEDRERDGKRYRQSLLEAQAALLPTGSDADAAFARDLEMALGAQGGEEGEGGGAS